MTERRGHFESDKTGPNHGAASCFLSSGDDRFAVGKSSEAADMRQIRFPSMESVIGLRPGSQQQGRRS